jgi:hypothetical protein
MKGMNCATGCQKLDRRVGMNLIRVLLFDSQLYTVRVSPIV